MLPEIRKMWTNALRSGEYTQGYTALARTDDNNRVTGHCCLGVLCDLHSKTENGGQWQNGPIDGCDKRYVAINPVSGLEGNDASMPPPAVEIWAEQDDKGWTIPTLTDRNGDKVELAEINDTEEFSFNQIADLIDYFM